MLQLLFLNTLIYQILLKRNFSINKLIIIYILKIFTLYIINLIKLKKILFFINILYIFNNKELINIIHFAKLFQFYYKINKKK